MWTALCSKLQFLDRTLASCWTLLHFFYFQCTAVLLYTKVRASQKQKGWVIAPLAWYGHVVPMLVGGCWWGKCWGLVAGRASKPRSLAAPCQLMMDRSPAWTGRKGRSNWRLSTTHRCGFYYTLWLALLNHAYMHIAHYWGFCRQCYEDSTTKNSKTHFWLHYWTKQKHTAHNIGAFIDNDTERTS